MFAKLQHIVNVSCCVVPQSNSLPGHVKINVTRENLFEDSFQQVQLAGFHKKCLPVCDVV